MLMLSFPIMAGTATPLAYSSFNGAKVVLYVEKGSCEVGQAGIIDLGKGAKPMCWIEQDGNIGIDDNDNIFVMPAIQFTIVTKKVYS